MARDWSGSCSPLRRAICTPHCRSSDFQALHTGIDMRRPKCNAFRDLSDHLPVVRLALLEAELEADLVVDRAAFRECLEQRLGLDAAPGVEIGREGAMPSLVHQALLDM